MTSIGIKRMSVFRNPTVPSLVTMNKTNEIPFEKSDAYVIAATRHHTEPERFEYVLGLRTRKPWHAVRLRHALFTASM
jgi:hypothetical protein